MYIYSKILFLRLILILILCNTLLIANSHSKTNGEAINLVVFTIDDSDANEIGAFGSQYPSITENMNAFARESIRLVNAYSTGSTCQTSRLSFISGRHPQNNGNYGHSDPLTNLNVDPLPNILSRNGYVTFLFNKFPHYRSIEPLKWDFTKVTIRPNFIYEGDRKFPERYSVGEFGETTKLVLDEVKKQGKPFFLHINSSDPHRPYPSLNKDEDRKFRLGTKQVAIREFTNTLQLPKKISVPPYLPELDGVTQEMKEHLTALNRADIAFGEVIQTLKDYNMYDNSLIVFFSDQGTSVPGSKQSLYPQGTRIPVMIKLPESKDKTTNFQNIEIDNLISIIDLYPTILDELGIQFDTGLIDGHSFSPLIYGNDYDDNQFVYMSYNYARPGLQVFPMRAVHDDHFLYIRNFWSDHVNPVTKKPIVYERTEVHTGLTWPSMLKSSDPEILARVDFLKHRAPEELYDLKLDPYALNNLIDNKGFEPQHIKLKSEMRRFMVQVNDPLLRNLDENLPLWEKDFKLKTEN